jgi:hypothetical protein
MYVLMTASDKAPTVSLEEPDDCSRFHVAIRDLAKDVSARTLEDEGVGTLEAQVAWIRIEALRKLAQGRVQPDWPQRFSDMLQYAERNGWLSEDRESVRGHCEWIP